MNVLIAPDSFKDAASAVEVAQCLRSGVEASGLAANIRAIPLADGGEGTVEALVHATGGTFFESNCADPRFRPIRARWGSLGDGETAIIEMAAASGLQLLRGADRNPWETSTVGTGTLISDALKAGFRRFIIGIGGSATNDGGVGALAQLGVRFDNEAGKSISLTGGGLSSLHSIDTDSLMPEVLESQFVVACDVTNPLTGPTGAAQVYGAQKGADEQMIRRLDRNLGRFARIWEAQHGISIEDLPGAGAAGGLGGGLMAGLGAKLVRGFEVMRQYAQIDEAIEWADLIFTGEGSIDHQSAFGKLTWALAERGHALGTPTIAFGGQTEILHSSGPNPFAAVVPISDQPMTLESAIQETPRLLKQAAEQTWRLIHLGAR
ncbi:glycerate kinase [Pontibacter sp. G13]|uniref:glycerate kinase n=1 Tax=Pontibacter sp. G13 TaxID=3074898 RepID=UPI00288BF655|nr:glycerate kinase [Pontibacter sp. G13]WNJ17307.1 glycerate kinase [Pontibacter sp. G13]